MTLSESDVVLEAVGLTKHFPVRKRLRDVFSRTPWARAARWYLSASVSTISAARNWLNRETGASPVSTGPISTPRLATSIRSCGTLRRR